MLYPEYAMQFSEAVAAITGEGAKHIYYIVVEDGGALGGECLNSRAL